MATTDIGRAVPLLRGEYDPAQTYELNDIVSLNGSLYWHYSHEVTTNVAPQATSTWKVVLSLTDAEAYIARAESAAEEAESAKDDAVTAKTAAETASTTATGASEAATAAKDDAVTARNAAQTAETGAVEAKNAAVSAKEAAQSAASSAGTSATNAGNSAGTAEYYAENAETAAETATTKASEASASAATASSAATTATEAKNTAVSSASTATTKAGEASTSATSAASSAAAAQAVKDSIPQDYSALSEDVSDLKTQLNDIAEETSILLIGTKITGKFIGSSATIADASFAYYVTAYDINPGDNVIVSGAAGNNGYLYIFTNSNEETIANSEKNTSGAIKSYENIKIKAPVNAVKLIISSHSSSSYTQAKAEKITGYRVIGLDELEDEVDGINDRVTTLEDDVDNAETNIVVNEAKTKALKTSVDPLFEYSVKSGTGELMDVFSDLTGLNIENASSAIIRSAQIFEPLYNGGSVAGVTVTKNSDGSYTFNGTATTSAAFYLNQSTRTGHDKLIPMNGNYSCCVKVLSGKVTPGSGQVYGRFIIANYNESVQIVDNLSMWLIDNDNKIENVNTGGAINAIIGIYTVGNSVYDNLTIKVSVNKGENVIETESEYVEPVTITDMGEALNAAKACLPYIWITATPNTASITAIGKTIKEVETPDPPAPVEPIDRYSVLMKYNDRVDTLMQMFNKPLFLVYTDIHASLANLERINTWANANKSSIYVSDTYCLGDMLWDHPGDDRPITDFDNVAIWPKTLKVIGNHDVGTGSSELTAKQTYDAYIAPYISQWGNVVQPSNASTLGKSYYYKDYNNKIRIIVLDIYHYDSDQSAWFESVLADAHSGNNNLAVIIAQHADICTAAEKEPLSQDYPFARKHNGYTGLQYSLSYTSQRAAVDAFIENGGTFICWLTGHMHADMVGTYTGAHGKQLSLVLANAGMSNDGPYLRFNNYSQDCFTYLGIDTDTKYLYLLRIGESVDKWFHKNLFLCYDYVNHALIEYH